MIDDKKIEEAAQLLRFELIASMHGSTLSTPMQCFKEEVDTETELIENSFITGAKWAINEFLKDLWHPIEEKPQKEKVFLYQSSCYGFGLKQISDTKDWNFIVKYQKLTQWLYIDDLISKI